MIFKRCERESGSSHGVLSLQASLFKADSTLIASLQVSCDSQSKACILKINTLYWLSQQTRYLAINVEPT